MKSPNFYVGHNFYKHTGLQTEHTQGLNSVFVALPVYNLSTYSCVACVFHLICWNIFQASVAHGLSPLCSPGGVYLFCVPSPRLGNPI